MTTTDLVIHNVTSLSLNEDQRGFTDQQVTALRHMGVEEATPADLEVFFHVAKRSGLDPFARQIHMIGRNSKNQRTDKWEVKYTIQTGIDGYRLIGRRAADRAHVTISIAQPEWAHEDGTWRPVWSRTWGMPVASRVTIMRDGLPFTAVAIFDEYKQTKRDGELTSMWAQRPAGQIAKCAEALAWRMAFPQDLSGIYTDDEMGQSDNHAPEVRESKPTGMAAIRQAVAPQNDAGAGAPAEVEAKSSPADGTETPAPASPLTAKTRGRMFALLAERGITDPVEQRAGMEQILGRYVTSRGSLTEEEAVQVCRHLVANVPVQPALTGDTE